MKAAVRGQVRMDGVCGGVGGPEEGSRKAQVGFR